MSDLLESMKRRYSNLHPLLFVRSVERSQSAVELFDILEEIPEKYPLIWDEDLRRWVITDDILQSQAYQKAEEKAGYGLDLNSNFE